MDIQILENMKCFLSLQHYVRNSTNDCERRRFRKIRIGYFYFVTFHLGISFSYILLI